MTDPFLPLLAFFAGVLSFSSPCCLPLVPAYVSYVSGLQSGAAVEGRRRVALRGATLFVIGFTLVFTVLGLGASAISGVLLENREAASRVAGGVVIALGVVMLGVVYVPWMFKDRRPALRHVPTRPAWALPMGMAFAAGWAPCVGPILAAVLAIASSGDSSAWGGVLLLIYSLGLGIPFLLVAAGIERMQRSVAWLRRNTVVIERGGGVLMILVGVLMLTGAWQTMWLPLMRWFAGFGWPPV